MDWNKLPHTPSNALLIDSGRRWGVPATLPLYHRLGRPKVIFIKFTGPSVASDLSIGQTRALGQSRSVSHSVRPSICRAASPAGRLYEARCFGKLVY